MSNPPESQTGASVKIEGGMLVIRMPVAEAHGFRVALAECPCKAPKATATKNIRQRLSQAIGRLTA